MAQHRWYGDYGDASRATVSVDGVASTIDRVRSSDFVRVRGIVTRRHFSDGHDEDTFGFTSIVDDATVMGPVDSADLQHRRLIVMNQPVSFLAIDTNDCATCDADAALPSVKVGDFVRVSGFVSDDGSILANRIDPATTSVQVRVEGTVRSLDAGSRRFQINGLVIDYRAASVSGLSGAVRDGLRVQVVGDLQTSPRAVAATEVTELAPPLDAGDFVRFEGVIDAATSSNEIDIGGYQVTEANCDPAVHAVVNVSGSADGAGTIVASWCALSTWSPALSPWSPVLSGPIDAIDRVHGTLDLLGVTVQTNFTTIVQDDSAGSPMNITMGDLEVGDFVSADGLQVPRSPTDGVVGTGISRVPATEMLMWGRPTRIADPDIIIFGRTIHTVPDTLYRNHDACDHVQGSTANAYFQEGSLDQQKITVKREADDSLTAVAVDMHAGRNDSC